MYNALQASQALSFDQIQTNQHALEFINLLSEENPTRLNNICKQYDLDPRLLRSSKNYHFDKNQILELKDATPGRFVQDLINEAYEKSPKDVDKYLKVRTGLNFAELLKFGRYRPTAALDLKKGTPQPTTTNSARIRPWMVSPKNEVPNTTGARGFSSFFLPKPTGTKTVVKPTPIIQSPSSPAPRQKTLASPENTAISSQKLSTPNQIKPSTQTSLSNEELIERILAKHESRKGDNLSIARALLEKRVSTDEFLESIQRDVYLIENLRERHKEMEIKTIQLDYLQAHINEAKEIYLSAFSSLHEETMPEAIRRGVKQKEPKSFTEEEVLQAEEFIDSLLDQDWRSQLISLNPIVTTPTEMPKLELSPEQYPLIDLYSEIAEQRAKELIIIKNNILALKTKFDEKVGDQRNSDQTNPLNREENAVANKRLARDMGLIQDILRGRDGKSISQYIEQKTTLIHNTDSEAERIEAISQTLDELRFLNISLDIAETTYGELEATLLREISRKEVKDAPKIDYSKLRMSQLNEAAYFIDSFLEKDWYLEVDHTGEISIAGGINFSLTSEQYPYSGIYLLIANSRETQIIEVREEIDDFIKELKNM